MKPVNDAHIQMAPDTEKLLALDLGGPFSSQAGQTRPETQPVTCSLVSNVGLVAEFIATKI